MLDLPLVFLTMDSSPRPPLLNFIILLLCLALKSAYLIILLCQLVLLLVDYVLLELNVLLQPVYLRPDYGSFALGFGEGGITQLSRCLRCARGGRGGEGGALTAWSLL